MKKFLVGCGVLLGLFLVGVGGLAWWFSSVVKDVAGDFTGALQLAVNMPTDRMEQEAITVEAPAVQKRLPELLNQPVRISGVVGDPAKHMPPNAYQPPQDPSMPRQQLFLEPGILVMQGPGSTFPVGNVEGRTVEVMGIFTRLTLGNAPGMTDEARKQLQGVLGGTDMPVVIARKVELVVGAK